MVSCWIGGGALRVVDDGVQLHECGRVAAQKIPTLLIPPREDEATSGFLHRNLVIPYDAAVRAGGAIEDGCVSAPCR